MPIVYLRDGTSFVCDDEQAILNAAIQAGHPLAYGCQNGRCGSCKCIVKSGSSFVLFPEIGLSSDEKEDGYILTCARAAATDLVLDLDGLGDIELPQSKIFPCRINSLSMLSGDVINVELRLPPVMDFRFIPGQYVDVIGPGGIRRSYSLASGKKESSIINFHIRSVPNGVMSKYWFEDARINDVLRIYGPLGTFFLRNVGELDLVLLATGTGIAPMKALLEGLFFEGQPQQAPRSVSVYWGGRKQEDLYFDVSAIHGGFRYIPVLSKVDHGQVKHGYVQDAFLETKPDLSKVMVYACGSEKMIHSSQEALFRAGLPKHRFVYDAFVCSGPI